MITTFLRNFFTIKPTRTKNADTKVSVLLAIGIVLTQIGDYASTKLGMSLGAAEGNSVMSKFITEHGFDTFLQLKLAAAAFLVWTCWKRPLASSIIVLLYVAVIVYNLFIILKLVG